MKRIKVCVDVSNLIGEQILEMQNSEEYKRLDEVDKCKVNDCIKYFSLSSSLYNDWHKLDQAFICSNPENVAKYWDVKNRLYGLADAFFHYNNALQKQDPYTYILNLAKENQTRKIKHNKELSNLLNGLIKAVSQKVRLETYELMCDHISAEDYGFQDAKTEIESVDEEIGDIVTRIKELYNE